MMRTVDMHCDTIAELYKRKKMGIKEDLLENSLTVDIKKMQKGDYLLQNFALFVNLKESGGRPFTYCIGLLDTFYEEMEKNSGWIRPVTSLREIEENRKAGRLSALLTIEEGGVCEGNLEFLRTFYRLGVRMMTLVWNHENELGFPNKTLMLPDGRKTVTADTEHGLTETGIAFLGEMERLGMIVDISHLNDAGIHDVFRHTTKPFVASHSNARALAPHPRNLTDDMIRSLSERGGVMGINYYAPFLSHMEPGEQKTATMEEMISHMKHIKNVGGIQCIGLGSDFDGIDCPVEMKDPSELPKLEAAMRRAGFTEREIEAVFYENVLRVYREVLG